MEIGLRCYIGDGIIGSPGSQVVVKGPRLNEYVPIGPLLHEAASVYLKETAQVLIWVRYICPKTFHLIYLLQAMSVWREFIGTRSQRNTWIREIKRDISSRLG